MQLIGRSRRTVRVRLSKSRFIGSGGVLQAPQMGQAVANFGVGNRGHAGGAGIARLHQGLELLASGCQFPDRRLGGAGR